MQINPSVFKNKKILITGGTGSFGNAFVEYVAKLPLSKIIIFSRDELKQHEMREKYKNKKLAFFIGDVRDKSSISKACKGVDFVFHAAALKQVPSCEYHPIEAFKTNVLGTMNVINASKENNIKKIVCLSTDKSVYPINVMGLSKSMMEKIAISESLSTKKTKICVVRYGNIIGSRGSLIPQLIKQMKNNLSVTITDKKMTRFMMSMHDAIKLVIYALIKGKNGQIIIYKSKSTNIMFLEKTVREYLKKTKNLKFIGIREGEKIHETLITEEEMLNSTTRGDFIEINNYVKYLDYEKYLTSGKKIKISKSYSSDKAKKLSTKEIIALLKSNNLL